MRPTEIFIHCATLTSIVFGFGCSERAEQARVQAAPGKAPPGMIWVPGGDFQMGSAGEYATEAEKPVHHVRVDGFFMDAQAVTNAQFRVFVETTRYVTVAERAPTAEEILAQMPAGTKAPPPELL